MSVILGPDGKVLLGPGGKIATDTDCCCGETPPCECPGYSPYENESGCYTTDKVDCCGTDDGFFVPVDCGVQFRTLTCLAVACADGWTGSITIINQINEDTCNPEFVSCSGGPIRNELGVIQYTCDNFLLFPPCESCDFGIKTTATLSNPCIPPFSPPP